MPPPVENLDSQRTDADRQMIAQMPRCAAVGDVAAVRDGMASFINTHQADELILVSSVFDHRARLRSFELAMQAAREINA